VSGWVARTAHLAIAEVGRRRRREARGAARARAACACGALVPRAAWLVLARGAAAAGPWPASATVVHGGDKAPACGCGHITCGAATARGLPKPKPCGHRTTGKQLAGRAAKLTGGGVKGAHRRTHLLARTLPRRALVRRPVAPPRRGTGASSSEESASRCSRACALASRPCARPTQAARLHASRGPITCKAAGHSECTEFLGCSMRHAQRRPAAAWPCFCRSHPCTANQQEAVSSLCTRTAARP